MPAKYLMSWEPHARRWWKMYRGKRYVRSCRQLGAPETKEGSYQLANEWWRKTLAEIEGTKPEPAHADVVAGLERRREWANRHGEADLAKHLTEQIDAVAKMGEHEEPDPEGDALAENIRVAETLFGIRVPDDIDQEVARHYFGDRKVWQERHKRDRDAPPVPEDLTVAFQVRKWLEVKETLVVADQLSPGEYKNLRLSIDYFRDWIGGEMLVEKIDEKCVHSFYMNMLSRIAERLKDPKGKAGWGRDHASKTFRVARSFIRALWEANLIALPKNIDSRTFKFGKSPRKIPTMTVEEFRGLVATATGQLKLHLMLMANCGMTQVDVAELKDHEVDWANGRVIRRRSKTRDHEDVPVVDYKLWPLTFELLRKYRSGEETVLLTRSGKPWVYEVMLDGRRKATDNVATLYTHLKRKLKGYDLRLMSWGNDVSGIPTAGKSLVIVTEVKNALHFRIFDRDGQKVVDTDETKLATHVGPIEELRKQLESLWPPHEPTESQKTRVIAAITSIVDYTPNLGTDFTKPLKLIRKTSATMLNTHRVYGRFCSHFLGHSPRSIADRNYVAPAQELFDEAVAWLGEQYGY